MIVRVLGSAAGGGLPQWNCACPLCAAARQGRIPRRTQSSLAVSGDGERWWLVNASPDVAQQIEAFAPLQPVGGRASPIAGMLFTDANVDHLGGLAVLRQSGGRGFALWSTQTVRDLALAQVAFARFAESPHEWRVFPESGFVDLDEHLRARAVPVAGTTPGYAGRRPQPGAVVAIALEDRTSGKIALAAPVFASVDAVLRAAVTEADVAFLDGSFYREDELAAYDVEGKAARYLGHLPVGGEDGSLRAFADLAPQAALLYTHLNNTNPLGDPDSAESKAVRAAGLSVAVDGLTLTVP